LFDSTTNRKSDKTEREYRTRNLRRQWMVPFICLMILCGCGSQFPLITDGDAPDQKIILKNPPKSIAILPFGNSTEEQDLEKFVRTTVYSHLTPHPYRDMELHEVDRRLTRHNLLDSEKLGQVSVKKLGRILGCDAVVMGEVTEFSRVYAGVYSQMAVGASISIWDTRSGEKLWSDEHVTRHHEGGIPLAITDLAFITIRSGLNLRESERVKTVDELSRYLISRVPVPDTGSNGKSRKFVSLKQLTKKENSTPSSTSGSTPDGTSSRKKLRSLKKLTKVTHQRYR